MNGCSDIANEMMCKEANQFDYTAMAEWPLLAWLAVCRSGSHVINVYHGMRVETRAEWFCEAVWAGPFAEGSFDLTDVVAGSGGRIRDGNCCFVTSGTGVDRLQYMSDGEIWLISNSFACLSAVTGSGPDTRYRGYIQLFLSRSRGINQYERKVPLTNGHLTLVYDKNVVWDGSRFREIPKPAPSRDFSSYEKYISFLEGALSSIRENMTAADRVVSYHWCATFSSGYDSTMIAALARVAGLKTVYTIAESEPGREEAVAPIAEVLGFEVEYRKRNSWQHLKVLAEPFFIGGDARGKDVLLAGIGSHLENSVLLTGAGGGWVWSGDPQPISNDWASGGVTGLPFTEYRLYKGCIHFALAFIGMRHMDQIARISHSREMDAWRVGGSYDNPISRRYLEECGVGRKLFGIEKAGAAIRYVTGQDPWSKRAFDVYLNWLGENRVLRLSRFRLIAVRTALKTHRALLVAAHRADPRTARRAGKLIYRVLYRLVGRQPLLDYPFIWAMDHLASYYPSTPQLEDVVRGFRAKCNGPTDIN